LTLQDAAAQNNKAAQDTMTLQDAASRNDRPASDTLAITDKGQPDSTGKDTVALSDSVSVQANAFHPVVASDTVAISDAPAPDRTARDTLAIADKGRPDITGKDAVALSDSASGQSAVFHPATATDQLTLADSGRLDNTARDQIFLSDSASLQSAVFHLLSASDTVFLSEFASLPRTAFDALQLSDVTSLPSRLVSSVMDIADAVTPTPGKGFLLDDSLAVNVQMIVSVYWDRFFDETLGLMECTPFSCTQGLHFGDGLSISDEFAPPPKHVETIAASDSVDRTALFARAQPDTLNASDAISVMVVMAPPAIPPGSPAPPLSAMIVSDKNTVAPIPGAAVTGTYPAPDSDPVQLVSQLNLPTIVITGAVPRPALPAMTVVLPVYHVNLIPSARLPGDDAMLTVKVAEIPAETPVMVPINIAATPETAEHAEIPWMKMEYTPKVDSTDFALMVSMMDSPPAGAQPPQANFTPLFIDVKWVGSFSAASPDTSDYYRNLPTLTFAVTEAWASRQNVQRDANNVPIVSLSLFNEAAGTWESITRIDRPSGVLAGQYVYVAHLDHFSTYGISANSAPHVSGPVTPSPPSVPSSFVAHLDDFLTAADASKSSATEFIEEFSKNKKILVTLADIVRVAVKPVAYETLQVGKDVTVDIALEKVEAQRGALGRATATLLLQMKNSGGSDEQFVLDYSYMGEDGKTAYRSSSAILLQAGESKRLDLEVPFTKPGSYQLVTEARSVDGSTIAFAQIDVEVSWLEVNLYLVVAAAIAVIAGSAVTLAVLMLKRSRAATGVSM
jgi:hypothetical protein